MNNNSNPVLPLGWAHPTIGEVTGERVDQSGPSGSAEFLYVDISSIDTKTKKIREPKTLRPAQAPSRARQRLKPMDVVVSMTRPNLNAVAMVPAGIEGAIGSTGFDVLRTQHIEPSWLFYLVQSSSFVESMSMLVQGALYPAVRPKDIRAYQMPLAPLPEQRRIVAEIEKQFTRLDAAVPALKRVQANLKRYRASVLKAACEGRLVPTEAELARREGRSYEPASALLDRILAERLRLKKIPATLGAMDISEIPEGWAAPTVEQVSSLVQYGSSAKAAETLDGGIPVLRMGNITSDGRLDLGELKYLPANHNEFPELLLTTGDLLFNRTNSAELVGKSAVYRGHPEPCSFASYLIRVKTISGCEPRYLALYLNSGLGRKWIKSVVSQQVGQANVNGTKLQAFIFPLPPLPEQHRILAEADRKLSVVEEQETIVEKELRRAERLRQSILKRAFEGKLAPQDPNDEPAAALLERIRGTAIPGPAPGGPQTRRSNRPALIPKETANA